EAYANPNTDAHKKKNSFFLYLIHCNNEPDPSLNTRLILLSFCPIQPPFASGIFLLHLPESAARSSPSVASAGSNLKLVVFPNPNREDLGKAFRDWDPWGPFFFIVFLGLTLSWSASVKKQLMSMIRYAINHIVKFTIKCCSHESYVSKTMSEVFVLTFATCSWSSDPRTKCIFSKASALIQATVYKHLINAGSIYSISEKKWGEVARKICLDDVEVKLGELEAELFVIKAINDNLWRPYNELVEFRYPRNCSYTEWKRDPENYLKYSVQDIERIVLDFFEEYTHVTPAKLEDTMKKKIGEVGNKDSVVQINCIGDMSLKSLLKDGFVFEHDFLQVVAAVHIGWILLFVFICGIKSLNFKKKENRNFVP
ncbi:hypothetical protein HID58_026959, partial [Brassica napus]